MRSHCAETKTKKQQEKQGEKDVDERKQKASYSAEQSFLHAL